MTALAVVMSVVEDENVNLELVVQADPDFLLGRTFHQLVVVCLVAQRWLHEQQPGKHRENAALHHL